MEIQSPGIRFQGRAGAWPRPDEAAYDRLPAETTAVRKEGTVADLARRRWQREALFPGRDLNKRAWAPTLASSTQPWREPMRPLTRLFRFLLDVQGAIVTGARVNSEDDAVDILIRRHASSKPRCPKCDRILGGEIKEVEVRWRHRDALRKRCYLVGAAREGRCPKHGRRIERVPWADTRARHTYPFDEAVARMVQVADKTTTSELFRIAWRTVGRIVKRVVARLLPEDLLDGLTAIGVDETSYKRAHRYLTVVSCLKTGKVVWVGEGKTAATFGQFFDRLGPERCARIELVAMDMSGAYLKAARKWVPKADIVYDRFHVVQLLLEAIDEIRREESAKADAETRKAIQGSRFALLRNPAHRKPWDFKKIEAVRKGNRHLFRSFELRVDFEQLWEIDDEIDAAMFLIRWTRSALRSRLEPLCKFARTVRDKMMEILGFIRWRGITNAVLEGTNNKIQLLIHKAYGFHKVQSLIAMVYLCCSGIAVAW